MKSKCCEKPVRVIETDKGGYYICSECFEPTEVWLDGEDTMVGLIQAINDKLDSIELAVKLRG